MSRRSASKKRLPDADSIYNSRLVSMFSVHVLKDGKKSKATKIIYNVLDIIKQRTSEDALGILEKAVRNVTPLVEVKARRVGGSTYQVPIEVKAPETTVANNPLPKKVVPAATAEPPNNAPTPSKIPKKLP